MDCDVLIVGAGPTGLTAALELVRRGFSVRIIDKQVRPQDLSKALGINARSLELLQASGVTEKLIEQGLQVHHAHLYDRDKVILQLELSAIDHPLYDYILLLPQNRTEAILEEHLGAHNISVERNQTLVSLAQAEDGVESMIEDGSGNKHITRSTYVFGADGAHSTVRDLLHIDFEGEQFQTLWFLYDVKLNQAPSEAEINIYMHDGGSLLFIGCMGSNRYRLISNQEDWEQMLPDGVLIQETMWSSEFKISKRIVSNFQRQHVFIAGDAAHLHPPLGGRGMNLGIDDAWEFAYRLKHGSLKDYSKSRLKRARHVVKQTSQFLEVLTDTNPLTRFGRDMLAGVAGNLPGFQRAALSNMSGLDSDRLKPEI